MPNYTLNRDYTYRSVTGVVSFKKGEPTWVVPAMEKELIAIGAERVDGEAPEVLDPAAPVIVPLSAQERRDELFTAFQMLTEKNDSKDFTGAGVPTIKAVEKIVSFDVDRTEIVELWGEFKVMKAEAE